jgi:hypothetical protein
MKTIREKRLKKKERESTKERERERERERELQTLGRDNRNGAQDNSVKIARFERRNEETVAAISQAFW